jgi:hypothetical protein
MRRRRTLQAVLVLALTAAPAAGAAGAYAAESPIAPGLTRCDVATQVDPGVVVNVGTTGEDLATGSQYGAALAHGSVDDTWTVPARTPDDAYSIARHPAWIAASAPTNWINSRTDYRSSGSGGVLDANPTTQRSGGLDPISVTAPAEIGTLDGIGPVLDPAVGPSLPTTTTFRATFEVSPNSFLNRLSLSYAADNGVTFYLNGTPIGGFDPVGADPTAFTRMRPLAYAGPLIVDGTNTLDAVVTDYGVATGLLVNGGYEGCLVRYAAGTCVDIREDRAYAYQPQRTPIDTGSHYGNKDLVGTIDSKWTSNATTFGTAFSVAPYSSAWYSASTRANWIHAFTDPTVGTGSLTAPRTYRYRTEFTMGAGTAYRDLDLRWAADNDVTFILNGTTIGTFSGASTSYFKVLHPLLYAGPFNTGTNVLEAVVTDYGVATGLLVEGDARSCVALLAPAS